MELELQWGREGEGHHFLTAIFDPLNPLVTFAQSYSKSLASHARKQCRNRVHYRAHRRDWAGVLMVGGRAKGACQQLQGDGSTEENESFMACCSRFGITVLTVVG